MSEFITKYREIEAEVTERLADVISTEQVDNLAFMLYCDGDEELEEEGIDNFKDEQDKYYTYKMLVEIALLGFYGKTENDRDETEVKIGYKDFHKSVKVYLISKGDNNLKDIEKTVADGYIASERDITSKDYNEKDDYRNEDLATLTKYLTPEKKDDSYITELKRINYFLENNCDLKKYLEYLRTVYTRMLGASFGIDEYVGVVTHKGVEEIKNGVIKYNTSAEIKSKTPALLEIAGIDKTKDKITPDDTTSFIFYSPKLRKREGEEARVFDTKEMAYYFTLGDENNKYTLYYPYKILEIIKKQAYMCRAKKLIYKDNTEMDTTNCETYVNSLIPTELDLDKQNIYTDLIVYMHNVLNNKINDINKLEKKHYSALDFGRQSKNGSDLVEKLKNYSKQAIEYFIACVSTAIIAKKLKMKSSKDSAGKSIQITAEYRFLIMTNKGLSKTQEEYAHYFKGDTDNLITDETKYEGVNRDENNPVPVTLDGFKTTTDYGSIQASEFAFIIDKQFANAVPNFAIKMLNKLIKQKKRPKYNELVIGEKTNGEVMRVDFTKKSLHHIIAGSRSGKGVMCYNIFATAFGLNVPIFYCDNKPDTSSVMTDISKSKDGKYEGMFIINGAKYDKDFDRGGQVLSNDIKNFNIPSYVSYLSDENSRGYFAYYRSIMLVLEMLVFLDEADSEDNKFYSTRQKMVEIFKESDECAKNNVILVIDEFSVVSKTFNSFFTKELATQYSYSDTMFSERFVNQVMDKITKAEDDLDKKESSSKPDKVAIEKARKKVNEEKANFVKENTVETINFGKIYGTQLYKSMEKLLLIKGVIDKVQKGSNYRNGLQVFLIGQELPHMFNYIDEVNMDFAPNGHQTNQTGQTVVRKGRYTDTSKDLQDKRLTHSKNGGSIEDYDLVYHFLSTFSTSKDYLIGSYPAKKDAGKKGLGNIMGIHPQADDDNGKTPIKKNGIITEGLMNGTSRGWCYIPEVADKDTLETLGDTWGIKNGEKEEVNKFIRSLDPTFFKSLLILNNAEPIPQDMLDEKGEPFSDAINEQLYTKTDYQYLARTVENIKNNGISYQSLLEEYPVEEEKDAARKTKIDPGIGFEGFVSKLFDGDMEKVRKSMSLSSKLANIYVREVYGYKGLHDDDENKPNLAEEFCHDFRAEYILTPTRWANNPEGSLKVAFADTFCSEALKPWIELLPNNHEAKSFYNKIYSSSNVTDTNNADEDLEDVNIYEDDTNDYDNATNNDLEQPNIYEDDVEDDYNSTEPNQEYKETGQKPSKAQVENAFNKFIREHLTDYIDYVEMVAKDNGKNVEYSQIKQDLKNFSGILERAFENSVYQDNMTIEETVILFENGLKGGM